MEQTTPIKKSARLAWLDIARGLCILCMVTVHQFDWSRRNYKFIGFTGSWFLVFFFFCSGICYSDKLNFKDYISKQFKKLILPYTAVTGFYLVYRLYNGIWYNLPLADRIKSRVLSMIFVLPSDVNNALGTGLSTIGIGPIWFLVCMFFSGLIYKCIYRCNNRYARLAIAILLAVVSKFSQNYFTAPLDLQNAFIGSMFIAMGDFLRNKMHTTVEKMKKYNIFVLCILVVLTFLIHGVVMTFVPYQTVNLGGNVYYMMSLISTYTGFAFLIVLSVLIEKGQILDEFLAFCGKESLFVLILHNLDILVVRNWAMRDNSFLIGTLLAYPFIIYLFNRAKNK